MIIWYCTGQLTTWCNDDHWYELLVLTVLSARYKALVVSWMRVAVNVNKERSWHQMRRYLHLLIDHVVVGITDQRPVVSVKEHLLRKLLKHTTVNNTE